MYASLLRISGALHLTLFEQPGKHNFFRSLLEPRLIFPLADKAIIVVTY